MPDDHDEIEPESRSDLIDEGRAAYVASFEGGMAPISPQLTAHFEVLYLWYQLDGQRPFAAITVVR
jgi:hypothetical protein